jgi:hypothetical protein
MKKLLLCLSLLSISVLASEKITEQNISAQHYHCLACIQDRRTQNIRWAMIQLRAIGIVRASKIPWQLLLGYGERLYDSQVLCEDCQANKENLLRE